MIRFSYASFSFVGAVLASSFFSANAHAVVGGGERDTTEPGVVAVLIQHEKDPTPETSFMCTGTLIAPHVILTAAHCVHEKFVGQGQSFYAFFGDDVDDSEQAADRKNFGYAKSVTAHPDFDAEAASAGGPSASGSSAPAHDVAIIVLLDKAPGVPRPIARTLDQSIVGGEVRAFGYGQTKPGDVNSAGRRYSLTTNVTKLTDDHIVMSSNKSLCEGDSGGPTFLVDKNGVARVAGVHSYVEHATSCTGENFDARIDHEAAWIDGLVAAADPGFSAEPVVEPSANGDDMPTPAEDQGTTPPSDGAKTTSTTSGCSIGSTNDRASAPAFIALALGLVIATRRRSSR